MGAAPGALPWHKRPDVKRRRLAQKLARDARIREHRRLHGPFRCVHCGIRWTVDAPATAPPESCPQCNAPDWERHRCAVCRGTWKPWLGRTIRPKQCPHCGTVSWYRPAGVDRCQWEEATPDPSRPHGWRVCMSCGLLQDAVSRFVYPPYTCRG